MNKLTIKTLYNGYKEIHLETDRIQQPLRGHKFVGLLGHNKYANDLTLLLDFYGLMPFEDNIFVQVGNHMEEKILEWVWGKGNYTSYDYNIDKDRFSNDLYGGLIDGKHKDKPLIAEVKTYFSKTKLEDGGKRQYELQALFYCWLLQKTRPEWKVTQAQIMTLWVPYKERYQPAIYEDRLKTWIIDYDFKTVDDLVDKAKERRDKILKNNTITIKYSSDIKKLINLIYRVNRKDPKVKGQPIELKFI